MNKCLVFDLDDTLYSEHQYVLSGFKEISSFLLQKQGIDGFLKEAWQLFQKNERGNIFNKTLDNLGVNYSEKLVKDLVSLYRQHTPDIELYDDAKWALDYFSGKIPLGLITDGYLVSQQQKIEALNISKYFKSLVMTDALGREFWKPHEKPYLLTQLNLNISSHHCVYIGDNVNKDFVTANRLGWKTVHIQRAEGEYFNAKVADEYNAQITLSTLQELLQVIDINY